MLFWTFLACDIVTTIIQIAGAASIGAAESNGKSPKTANDVLIAGLAIQVQSGVPINTPYSGPESDARLRSSLLRRLSRSARILGLGAKACILCRWLRSAEELLPKHPEQRHRQYFCCGRTLRQHVKHVSWCGSTVRNQEGWRLCISLVSSCTAVLRI